MLENILPVTRFLLVATAVITFLPVSGLVPSSYPLIYLSVPSIIFKQPTRLLTSFFFYNSDNNVFKLLMRFYSLYMHSQHLEISYFTRLSQYIYFLFFNMTMIILMTFYFKSQVYWVLEPSLQLLLSFTYSMVFWDNDIKYYGIIPIKCKYTCLIDLFFSFIFTSRRSFVMQSGILGLTSGYIYNCLSTESYGPVFGFVKYKILHLKEPQYIWEQSTDLKGEIHKFKTINPSYGIDSEKIVREYGFNGGIPLYPPWVDKLLSLSKPKGKMMKSNLVNVGVDNGRKLGRTDHGTSTKNEVTKKNVEKSKPSSTEGNTRDARSAANRKIADVWANKY